MVVPPDPGEIPFTVFRAIVEFLMVPRSPPTTPPPAAPAWCPEVTVLAWAWLEKTVEEVMVTERSA